jgi:hypothetical protein
MTDTPIYMKIQGAILIMNIIYLEKPEIDAAFFKSSGCSWSPSRALDPNIYLSNEYASLWSSYDKLYRRSLHILKSGTYLAFFDCQVTVQGPGM